MSRKGIPNVNPPSAPLRERILSMPTPGVIEITGSPWMPSVHWIRLLPANLSIRRSGTYNERLFIFRLP